MDKQQLAHILEKEISKIDINLRRLHRIYKQTIDAHQARDIADAIQDLVSHKKCLQQLILNIVSSTRNDGAFVEAGRLYNSQQATEIVGDFREQFESMTYAERDEYLKK